MQIFSGAMQVSCRVSSDGVRQLEPPTNVSASIISRHSVTIGIVTTDEDTSTHSEIQTMDCSRERDPSREQNRSSYYSVGMNIRGASRQWQCNATIAPINTRALSPKTFVPRPMVLHPLSNNLTGHDFSYQYRSVLRRIGIW